MSTSQPTGAWLHWRTGVRFSETIFSGNPRLTRPDQVAPRASTAALQGMRIIVAASNIMFKPHRCLEAAVRVLPFMTSRQWDFRWSC